MRIVCVLRYVVACRMRSVALILLWSILALLAQATPVVAQTPNRAALVVSYDEGVDVAVCVSFNEEEISGHELLRRAELGMKSEPSGGFGEAVCRIDVTGCDIPQQKCFCECLGADCFYWSYWRLENGAWKFSQQGSSSTTVRNGSVDGWVWGRGTLNQDAERLPPPIAYEEVCVSTTPTSTGTSTSTATATTPQQSAATPTFTPTPTPTVTATATHTREPSEKTATPTPLPSATPTSGPTSTVTPTPFVPPTILVFAPDRTPISFGDSVTLVWDVADSTRVILRYPGGEEEVAAQGSKAVSPEMTTQYALFAASPVGEAESVITVAVNAVISVPTPDTAVQESTPLPSQPTVTWTPTWTPEPTQTPEPTHTPLPTNTSVPEPTSTPIPESAVIAEAPAPVLAQQESPLVVTVVVTPESVEMTATEVDSVTPTPAIVLLEPVDSAEVAAYPGAEKESIPAAERAFMVGGLALVVGTPLIFAGIWLLVWLVWRRQ